MQYRTDKPYPICLIYGCTESGRHVHSVWAYNAEKQKDVLITVYAPDPGRWIDWKKRKKIGKIWMKNVQFAAGN
ncbi:MAG: DUF4258 domain-containing protein [Desulfococcaceae bacterium]